MFNWLFAPLVILPSQFSGIVVPLSHGVTLKVYETIVPSTIMVDQPRPPLDLKLTGFLVTWSVKF